MTEVDTTRPLLDAQSGGQLIAESVQGVLDAADPTEAPELLKNANADIASLGLKIVDTRETDKVQAERVAHIVNMARDGFLNLGRRSKDRAANINKFIRIGEIIIGLQDQLPVYEDMPTYRGTKESLEQVKQNDIIRYRRILASTRFTIALARSNRDAAQGVAKI